MGENSVREAMRAGHRTSEPHRGPCPYAQLHKCAAARESPGVYPVWCQEVRRRGTAELGAGRDVDLLHMMSLALSGEVTGTLDAHTGPHAKLSSSRLVSGRPGS